jgi:arylsulfatase A-like enzyme
MNERPNILFIMDDQHRFDYLGCAGAEFVRTPNIDRIAARGVRFTQCVTNCPVCAPARIGLAAGMQPCNLGSLDNHSYLPRSSTTIYQRFRDHGYRVGCVGKLDLAKPDHYNGRNGDRPCGFGWGFTEPCETEGKMHGGNSPTPLGPYGFWLQEQGLYEKFHKDYQARRAEGWIKGVSHDSVLPTEAFEESYIGRHAVDWLESVNDDFPWHYFVSFVGPHDPFDPPTEYADKYRDAPMPAAIQDELDGKPEWVRGKDLGMSDEEVAHTRRQYCAIIELIDHWIGEMVAVLERRGLLDNTIVVFTSDHGEMLGDHGMYQKEVPYEPAIRVPLIMAGPGVAEGQVSEALVELIDVNPTVCELAGLPSQENIDARSFALVSRGEGDEHRDEAISVIRRFRLIRTRTHKFIDHYNAGVELYDLANDPAELHNIADDNPDLVAELRRRLLDRTIEQKWRR